MHKKSVKILHHMPKKQRKGLGSQEDFAQYIRQLDRLHWEYLRLSDKYKEDWSANKGADSVMDKASVDYFQNKLAYGTERPVSVLWLRYGIHMIIDPQLSYENALAILKEADSRKSYLFFDALEEYAVYDGIFPKLNYDESPFVKISVNLSLPTDILAKVLRTFISERKDQLFDRYIGAMPVRKWVFPKNVHFDTLEETLRHYRMHKEGKSYREIASILAEETGRDVDSLWSLVKKNIPKAQRIMKHVEKGMFP